MHYELWRKDELVKLVRAQSDMIASLEKDLGEPRAARGGRDRKIANLERDLENMSKISSIRLSEIEDLKLRLDKDTASYESALKVQRSVNRQQAKEHQQATRKIINLDAEMVGLRERLRTANAVGSVSRDRTFALEEAVKKNHELLDEQAALKEEVASLKVQLEKSRKAEAGSFIGTWRGCDILLKGATTNAVETLVRHLELCEGVDMSERACPNDAHGDRFYNSAPQTLSFGIKQSVDSWAKQMPTAEPRTAEQIAAKVADVLKDREGSHGSKQENMNGIASMWTAYLEIEKFDAETDDLTGRDVCNMMVLMKVARQSSGDPSHLDHHIDAAGYAAIGGECALAESEAAK